MVWKIGLIGFGNVGGGFVRILHAKKAFLEEKHGFRFKVVGISDPLKGCAYDEDGLNIKSIVELLDKYGSIHRYEGGRKDIDSVFLAKESVADIIVEATPTNYETGEPGLTHIREALNAGKHVVTSNKGPISVAYKELVNLAKKKEVFLRFEGTVLSGTPCINLAKEALAGCTIYKIQGIVNGTTNFILTKMEEGYEYEEALREAQRLGYAEADPRGDVEGWDAAVKAVILANALMEGDLTIKGVERVGIVGVKREDVKELLKRGKRIKLIASIERENGKVKASVKPEGVPLSHPLANVMGVLNALTFTTDHLGEVTVIGPGAGRIETGQAILSDVLHIHRFLTRSAI